MPTDPDSRIGPATIGQAGEREMLRRFVAAAKELTRGAREAGVVVDTGDDAAVFRTAGPVVVSTDTIVAGRHFRLDWSTPEQVGRRAVIQAGADVAAMGGRLTGIVVSIGAPDDTPVTTAEGLNRGIAQASARWDATLLGGDLVATEQIVITVTALGRLAATAPVRLDGARAGDVLALSGPVGDAAAGLAVLAALDRRPDPELRRAGAAAIDAFRVPVGDLSQGVVAAEYGAGAMTDVSDGLIEELITISAKSGVRVDVSPEDLPRSAALVAAAAALDVEPTDWLVAGGEDHQLLAAFSDPAAVPPGWVVIGSVSEPQWSPTVTRPAVYLDGRPAGALRGWQSFDAAGG